MIWWRWIYVALQAYIDLESDVRKQGGGGGVKPLAGKATGRIIRLIMCGMRRFDLPAFNIKKQSLRRITAEMG